MQLGCALHVAPETALLNGLSRGIVTVQHTAEAFAGFPRDLIPPLHLARGCYFKLKGNHPNSLFGVLSGLPA